MEGSLPLLADRVLTLIVNTSEMTRRLLILFSFFKILCLIR